MHQIEAIADLRQAIRRWRRSDESIAFVPTMGNLHAGHLALIAKAKTLAARVVVSVFVNPLQFGPEEDFATYPRTLEQDRDKLQHCGIDILFTPSVQSMYPQGEAEATQVHVPNLSTILCGAFRPGHFDGVTTVVARLFNLVQPDIAVFGKKDYQQWRLIERMVRDLAMPVEVIGLETVREADGLAMSSRNQYLQPEERKTAAELYCCLQNIGRRILSGERDFASLQLQALDYLRGLGFKPDYIEIRKAKNLDIPDTAEPPGALVVLAAAYLGKARLIDNLEILA